MQNWIIYTIIYAMFTGFFQCAKKKAVEKNSIYEVLAVFSLMAFILVAFTSSNVFNIEMHNIFIILEPTTLPSTISLLPDRFALIDTASSGALVPKATIVSPIISDGIPKAFATLEHPSTNQSAHLISKNKPIIIKIKLITHSPFFRQKKTWTFFVQVSLNT